MKILLSCKANYRKDDIRGHLLCMREWVHVDEVRCKLSLEKMVVLQLCCVLSEYLSRFVLFSPLPM